MQRFDCDRCGGEEDMKNRIIKTNDGDFKIRKNGRLLMGIKNKNTGQLNFYRVTPLTN